MEEKGETDMAASEDTGPTWNEACLADIERFMEMAKEFNFSNVVMIGLGDQEFRYVFRTPDQNPMIGLMEQVKFDLILNSRKG